MKDLRPPQLPVAGSRSSNELDPAQATEVGQVPLDRRSRAVEPVHYLAGAKRTDLAQMTQYPLLSLAVIGVTYEIICA